MDYTKPAPQESVERTMNALTERGHLPELVETRVQALERVKSLIPAGASVMNGASRTLEEIGFVDHLKSGTHGWNNAHEVIIAEKDPVKKAALRKQAILSDFYIGSVHAVAETGEILIASNTGSQLPPIVFTSPNIIFVVGTHKIVPTLRDAYDRLEKRVIPLEDERMKSTGAAGTYPSKVLTINKEQPFMGRKSHVIFVGEALGF